MLTTSSIYKFINLLLIFNSNQWARVMFVSKVSNIKMVITTFDIPILYFSFII